MQCLRRTADLRCDRNNRRPARGMLALVVQNHPHRSGPDFGREFVRRLACHGSTFSRVGASGNPGAVQSLSLQFARAEAQASFRLGVKYLMHRQRRRTRYRRTGKTDRMAGQKPKTDLCFRPVPLAQSNLPDRATILNRLQNVVSDSRVDSVVDRSGIFCGRNTRP